MKQTIFLVGHSDVAKQDWIHSQGRDNSEEKPSIESSSSIGEHLCLPPFISGDATLRAKSEFLVITALLNVKFPKDAPQKVNFFNLICDADTSIESLRIVQALEQKIQPSRFFNRASDVINTSRGRLPKVLSNIPGCRVPRVKALTPKSFSELERACEEFEAWPVIVRARGHHAGKHMRLVEGKAQLHTLENESWLYEDLWLIEFLDYINEDKLYQKNRVVLVDGILYPRHSIFTDKWNVHMANRADLMDHDVNLCRREKYFLEYLRDEGLNRYADVFSAIHERIGLDIFGVDFALVDNEVVVFEANACMQFLKQDYGADRRYRYLETHIRVIKRAIKKMLMKS